MAIHKSALHVEILKRFLSVEELQSLMFRYEQAKKSAGNKSVELPPDFAEFGKALLKKEITVEEVMEHYKKPRGWVNIRQQKYLSDELLRLGF